MVQIDEFWGGLRLKRRTSACLCVFLDKRMSGPPLRKTKFNVKCGNVVAVPTNRQDGSCAATSRLSGPVAGGGRVGDEILFLGW